jgi:hypothetical protein
VRASPHHLNRRKHDGQAHRPARRRRGARHAGFGPCRRREVRLRRDLTSKVAQLRSDLDKRFDKFASQCLVASAPERCATAAGRFLSGLEALEDRVEKIRSRIDERCSGATPPERCAQTNGLLVQLDHLAEAASEYQAQIEAAYPNAGHAAERG